MRSRLVLDTSSNWLHSIYSEKARDSGLFSYTGVPLTKKKMSRMKVSSSALIAALGMLGLTGCATVQDENLADYKYTMTPVMLWVGTQSASSSLKYDATPGLIGLVSNALSLAKDMVNAFDKSNRVIYYKPVIPLLFGGPSCQGPYEMPLVEGADASKLIPGTLISDDDKTIKPVLSEDGQPILVTPQHPCYRIVTGKLALAKKPRSHSRGNTENDSKKPQTE